MRNPIVARTARAKAPVQSHLRCWLQRVVRLRGGGLGGTIQQIQDPFLSQECHTQALRGSALAKAIVEVRMIHCHVGGEMDKRDSRIVGTISRS